MKFKIRTKIKSVRLWQYSLFLGFFILAKPSKAEIIFDSTIAHYANLSSTDTICKHIKRLQDFKTRLLNLDMIAWPGGAFGYHSIFKRTVADLVAQKLNGPNLSRFRSIHQLKLPHSLEPPRRSPRQRHNLQVPELQQ